MTSERDIRAAQQLSDLISARYADPVGRALLTALFAIMREIMGRDTDGSQKAAPPVGEPLTIVYAAAAGGETTTKKARRKKPEPEPEPESEPEPEPDPALLEAERIADLNDLEAARSAGVSAGQDGLYASACPYVTPDPRREKWLAGWNAGYAWLADTGEE